MKRNINSKQKEESLLKKKGKEMKFTAIVPLKANSLRVPRKNFKLLMDKPLFVHIFEKLLQVPLLERVICWSSDDVFKDLLPQGVEFIKRASYLDGNEIKAKELFIEAAKQIETDYFVLTHATTPFIRATSITKGINAILDGYDSSFAVQEMQNYCWFNDKTLNYELDNPKQTQLLKSVYFETSGFYIYKRELMLEEGRRIGNNSKMIKVSTIESIDIDNEEDLVLAKMLESQLNKKKLSKYNLLQKKYTHAIFDMDGVIVDSLKLMEKAWNYSKGNDYADFTEYKKLIGMPFDEICIKLNIPSEKINTIKNNYFKYTKNNIEDIEVYENVLETLSLLKHHGFKISIVSSKNYENVTEIIRYFNISVDCIIAPGRKDYKGRHKPYPDPLISACIETGGLINESFFVGDMLVDYNASNAANIDFVFASYGYGDFPLLDQCVVIENISELQTITK